MTSAMITLKRSLVAFALRAQATTAAFASVKWPGSISDIFVGFRWMTTDIVGPLRTHAGANSERTNSPARSSC